jgi:hypothetical protein
MTPLRKLVRSIADNVNTWIERKTAQVTNLVPMETDSLHSHYYSYTKKIKIKRCSDVFFWYGKHIGETFDVVNEDFDRFWVRELDDFGCLNFVLKNDAEIV